MIKQILIMQALAEKNNIVCDTDILNAEFSRYFGSTDMTSYVNAYGENYVKTNILHDFVMQNQIDNVPKLLKLFGCPLTIKATPHNSRLTA